MDGRYAREKRITLGPPPTGIPRENRLLAALPNAARQRVVASCEPVELAVGDVLCEQGGRLSHVYFPIDSFISLIHSVDERSRVDLGLVGAEGMVGVSLILGMNIATGDATVLGSGSALRLDAVQFTRELKQGSNLEQTLKRYLYVFMSQLADAVACSRFHIVEARLARWLLMTRDRANSNEFNLTQEVAAYMLGVRRSSVCFAASALQKRELIRYCRGTVTILDGRGLAATSCACYAAALQTYARIMG
jgi:CRP-like cAMP-binding protein